MPTYECVARKCSILEDDMKETIPLDVLTLAEAAKRLKVSDRTLWQLSKDKNIPCFRVGRQYRYLASELDAWAISQSRNRSEA